MMPHSWDPTRPTMRQPPPTSTADEPQAYRFLVAAVVAAQEKVPRRQGRCRRACSVSAIVPLVVPRLGVSVGEALEAPRVGVLAIAVLFRAKNGLCMPRRQRRRKEARVLGVRVHGSIHRKFKPVTASVACADRVRRPAFLTLRNTCHGTKLAVKKVLGSLVCRQAMGVDDRAHLCMLVGVGVGVFYSITTFIRDMSTLLQIRQVA